MSSRNEYQFLSRDDLLNGRSTFRDFAYSIAMIIKQEASDKDFKLWDKRLGSFEDFNGHHHDVASYKRAFPSTSKSLKLLPC